MEPKKLYIARSYAELRERYAKEMEFEKKNTFANYVQSAARAYEAFLDAKKNGDEERSYCLAMRYCNIYSMLRKQFPDKSSDLKSEMPHLENALVSGEELASQLKKRYEKLSQSKNEPGTQKSGETDATQRPEVNNNRKSSKGDKKPRLQSNSIVESEKETISVNEFYQLVKSRNDDILLFDLREETDFSTSRIKINYQINIPESYLKEKEAVTSKDIELCLEEYSLSIWNKRNTFHYLIMCDWIGLDQNFVYGNVFSVLRDCLLKWSPEHPITVSPVILSGGFREVLDLFPTLTSNAKIDKPQYEKNKSILSKLDISKLSVKNEPEKPMLPNPEIIKVPNGVVSGKPVVDRSNKPKPKTIVSEKIPTENFEMNGLASYPDILSELSKQAPSVISPLPDIAATNLKHVDSVIDPLSVNSISEIEKPKSKPVPKVDRSLKPRLIVPPIEKDEPTEMKKLMLELERERKAKVLLEAEIERLKNEHAKEAAKSENVAPQGKVNDLELLREKKPIANKPIVPTVNEVVDREMQKEDGAVNLSRQEQQTRLPSEDVDPTATKDEAERSRRTMETPESNNSSSMEGSEVKSYVQNLRDDGSSSLSKTSGLSSLKRTNSSPSFANNQISGRDGSVNAVAGKPSPMRDRKPTAAMVLEIDRAHLKNFQPEYGNVSNGRCGLRNLGNTCYMNACLQCLSHTYLLREYIVRGKFFDYLNPNSKEGMGGYIVYEFTLLLRALWNSQYRVVSPVDLKAAMGKYRKQFKGTDQQDAQELLIALLDGLHEEVNMAGEKRVRSITDSEMANKSDSELAKIYWDNYSLNNRSIIVDIFQGQYRSVVQCTACAKKSTTFDAFMYLSLPIPRTGSKATLFDCFELYCQPEYIEWSCPNCKVLRKATKKLDVWRWPKYLIIHLKRFEFLNGYNRVKIQSKVEFPMTLTSDPSWKCKLASDNFSLYGVVQHSGTIDRGHYTANVYIERQNRQWFKFDDSTVSSISQNAVVSENAYILFYTSLS